MKQTLFIESEIKISIIFHLFLCKIESSKNGMKNVAQDRKINCLTWRKDRQASFNESNVLARYKTSCR